MRKLLFSVCTVLFLSILSTSLKAQVVITEYVKMAEDVEMNLKTKNVETAMTANKGVKDLEWNDETHILAITFDPRRTDVDEILRTLANITNNEAIVSKATTRRDSKMTTVASKMNP